MTATEKLLRERARTLREVPDIRIAAEAVSRREYERGRDAGREAAMLTVERMLAVRERPGRYR